MITVLVTPLKLLGDQFVKRLRDVIISAVSITAENATNELFEVISHDLSEIMSGKCMLRTLNDRQ
jgi:hypothetical protein